MKKLIYRLLGSLYASSFSPVSLFVTVSFYAVTLSTTNTNLSAVPFVGTA